MDNTTVDTTTLDNSALLDAIPADDRQELVSRREAIARGARLRPRGAGSR